MQTIVIALLNGVSYGLLLFMLSAGLTLSFGMLGVLNFAHASFYMLGAYIGYTVAAYAGFWAALVIAPIAVGLIGMVIERGLLRRARAPTQGLLLTFGLAYLLAEVVKLVWGLNVVSVKMPALLDGAFMTLHGAVLSRYRVFAMCVAIVMLAALYGVLRISKTGLIVRAALTHPHAVEALGHNVPRIFTLVFGVSTALAAAAGVIGAPLLVVEPAMAQTVGSIVFVVLIIGGLGSLAGAFIASLLIGCMEMLLAGSTASFGELAGLVGIALPPTWAALSIARFAPLMPYVLLIAILTLRPRGLLGQRNAEG